MARESQLMSVEELADYLKLQKQTIYNWLNQGKISGIKIGRVWRFDKKEVENWLVRHYSISLDKKEGRGS